MDVEISKISVVVVQRPYVAPGSSGSGSSAGAATVQGVSPRANARKPVVCILGG